MPTSSPNLPTGAGAAAPVALEPEVPVPDRDPSPSPTPPLPSPPPPPPNPHIASHTLAALQSLCYVIVAAIFTITFSLQPFRIPSASMEPTLLIGDFLLVDKREPASPGPLSPFPSSALHRGDVVVFYYPVDPSLHLVKRIIGLPGDRLRMHHGQVFINGRSLEEPYAVRTRGPEDTFRDNFPHLQSTVPDVDAHWWTEMHHLVSNGDLLVPPGRYFVLGDNRNDSEDSRYWGLVPRSAIVGEPILVYFSLRDTDPDTDTDSAASPSASPAPRLPRRHRSLAEAVVGLARWDRVLHVVR